MELDPGAQRVMEYFRASGRPRFETISPAEARAIFDSTVPELRPDPAEVAEVRELSAPGRAGPVRLRYYRGLGARSGPLPAMVYFHGGGWLLGDLESHDGVCRDIANVAGAVVVSVHYALAPEAKFPRAVEDAAAATRYVIEQARALGIDPAQVAVGGDSAGGNLAAVMALMSRDGDLPPLSFQFLIYPVTDMAQTQPSYAGMAEGYALTTPTMQWFRDHYLRDASDIEDWRASPLRAASLAGVAPAYIVTAAYDPLCDEAVDYARRLIEAGVPVTHRHLPDQMHGYVSMGRMIPAAFATISAAVSHWPRT